MCYAYKINNKKCIFIHIPKSCGKHIRHQIKLQGAEPLYFGWNVFQNYDRAHIPFIHLSKYVSHVASYDQIHTYVRNPYDRAVSTYKHMSYYERNKTPEGFKDFVKNKLAKMHFSLSFNAKHIHAYPQHMFLIDTAGNIPEIMIVKKVEDDEKPPVYDRAVWYKYSHVRKIVEKIYQKDFELFGYTYLNAGTVNVSSSPVMSSSSFI